MSKCLVFMCNDIFIVQKVLSQKATSEQKFTCKKVVIASKMTDFLLICLFIQFKMDSNI